MALRLVQRRNVRNSPPLEAGADQQAAKAAQHNTLNITGAQAFGQMRSMAGTPAVKPGEFAGRIGNVQYLHAPVPNGSDAFVHVNQASAGWIAAVGPSTSFVDTTIESWGAGAHAPTPERPSAVVAAIQDVTAA